MSIPVPSQVRRRLRDPEITATFSAFRALSHMAGKAAGLVALLGIFWLAPTPRAAGAEPARREVTVLADLAYKTGDALTDYEKTRCRLDLYLPKEAAGFATLVWFHGGALKEGAKGDEFNARIARSLAQAGVAVAVPNYRLSPKAKYPSYVEDAAAAFAWVHDHIAKQGGDPARVFVGGHSAGGYLSYMIGLDGRYLRAHGLETSAIAGLIPVSGQVMTHYTIREERGFAKDTIFADDAAPIHYLRKETPPWLILYAERDMAARAEENQYLAAALQATGNPRVVSQMIKDRDHGSIAGNIAQPGDPAAQAILEFIKP